MTDPADLLGRTAELTFTVTHADTAAAVGSGTLEVLGTPRMLAWCEAATCAATAPALTPGDTTVGTRVVLEHQSASPVGAVVTVRAHVTEISGRTLRYAVHARSEVGAPLAVGEIERVLVDVDRFLGRLR